MRGKQAFLLFGYPMSMHSCLYPTCYYWGSFCWLFATFSNDRVFRSVGKRFAGEGRACTTCLSNFNPDVVVPLAGAGAGSGPGPTPLALRKSGSSSGIRVQSGGVTTYDMTVFAPCQVVNGLPVTIQCQVRLTGGGTHGSSLSSSSLTGKGSGGDGSNAFTVVEDHSLEPGQSAAIHTGANARPEVR